MEVVKWNLSDNVELTENGLNICKDLSPAALDTIGQQLFFIDRAIQFAIGDFLVHANDIMGEDYTQLLPDPQEDGAKTMSTYQNYMWVARTVPLEKRNPNVAYSVYAEASRLTGAELDQTLEWIDEEKPTSGEVRQRVKAIQDNDEDSEVRVKTLVKAIIQLKKYVYDLPPSADIERLFDEVTELLHCIDARR